MADPRGCCEEETRLACPQPATLRSGRPANRAAGRRMRTRGPEGQFGCLQSFAYTST